MANITFYADNHYGKHCGKNILPALANHEVTFAEDDWQMLAAPDWVSSSDLLVLHSIAGTCSNPLPDDAVEANVKLWIDSGKPLLLLHGSSAAFWHWPWWRDIVGWRWVRPEDPDSIPKSTHPVRPYRIEVAKTRHPLCAKFADCDIPHDEIYTELEQVCPSWTILQTTTNEGTFPMCHVHTLPSGSEVIGFLPGHLPEVTTSKNLHVMIATLADWLTNER